MNVLKKEKGFTIIEVVLVLAIAGLIFLMVFIALPALQRSQRDTQRKNDMSRLQTAVVNYTNANRGSLPKDEIMNSSFVTGYLTVDNDSFIDPAGVGESQSGNPSTYVFQKSDAAPSSLTATFKTSQNIIYYTPSASCSPTEGAAVVKAGSRKIAFRMALESGGYNCINN